MLWSDRVRSFVRSLSEERLNSTLRNPYIHEAPSRNLELFLLRHQPSDACPLLIGEAPGYRGAWLSGIALTSLSILVDQEGDPWSAFGAGAGYFEPATSTVRKESTATIVWDVLKREFGAAPLPVTWNAVPFHPRGAVADSNRPIRPSELAVGERWLTEILELFPRATPVAVGRRASDALANLGVVHESVRHPSRGGKKDFARELSRVRLR